MVVVRGGGSKADLATFDAEPVARAIAGSDVPVWTGIGHTGDQSVADEVANRAFITPTECGQELARCRDRLLAVRPGGWTGRGPAGPRTDGQLPTACSSGTALAPSPVPGPSSIVTASGSFIEATHCGRQPGASSIPTIAG